MSPRRPLIEEVDSLPTIAAELIEAARLRGSSCSGWAAQGEDGPDSDIDLNDYGDEVMKVFRARQRWNSLMP